MDKKQLCSSATPPSDDEKSPEKGDGEGVDNPVFTVEAQSPTLVRPLNGTTSDKKSPGGEKGKQNASNGLTPELTSSGNGSISKMSNGTTKTAAKRTDSLTVPGTRGTSTSSNRSKDDQNTPPARRLRKRPPPLKTDQHVPDDSSSVSDQKSPAISITQAARKDSIGSYHSNHSESGSVFSLSGVSSVMSERLINLRRKFANRTDAFKERAAAPPSPTPSELEAEEKKKREEEEAEKLKSVSPPSEKEEEEKSDPTPPPRKRRLNSFLPSRASNCKDGQVDVEFCCCWKCKCIKPGWMTALKFPKSIDPQGRMNLTWLFIVMVAFLYNAVVIPLRFAFGELVERDDNVIYWLVMDYVCDLIYVIDITVFEVRMTFLDSGTPQTDPKEMRRNYFNKLRFKFDLICLIPTDLLYLVIGSVQPMLRLNRLFKISAFFEFYERCDQAAKNGHIIRILQTISVMLYLIHVEACGYYYASRMQNFNTTWTYSEARFPQVSAYVRCFYVATKTATSIGKNPIPTNNLEYMFMTAYWLSGVFVFALLIGQIRDIFEAAGFVQTHYRETMDITLWYMQSLNLPKHIKDRVRMWFNYNWDQQKTLDENSLIESLPKKMKTDLAIHVHFNTLSKVSLFQDCDKNLLYDMILKLEPVLYLPGDYICKKGEVGTEMYIVMAGQVQVVGGPNNDIVFATLHEGSVFGEISLLALAGGNRRTADVRSKGFSNLFTLSKVDFDDAMADYPEAHELLQKRAKKLLVQNKKHEKKDDKKPADVEIIKDRTPTPKLMKTVLKVLEPRSSITKTLGVKTRTKRPNKVAPVNPENHVTAPANQEYGDESRDVEKGEMDQSESRSQSRASRRLMARSVSEMIESDEEMFFSEEEIVLPAGGEDDSVHTPTPPPTVTPGSPTRPFSAPAQTPISAPSQTPISCFAETPHSAGPEKSSPGSEAPGAGKPPVVPQSASSKASSKVSPKEMSKPSSKTSTSPKTKMKITPSPRISPKPSRDPKPTKEVIPEELRFAATSSRDKTPYPRGKQPTPDVDQLLDECEEIIKREKKRGISVSYIDSETPKVTPKAASSAKSPSPKRPPKTAPSKSALESSPPKKASPQLAVGSEGVVNRGFVQSPSSSSLKDPKV